MSAEASPAQVWGVEAGDDIEAALAAAADAVLPAERYVAAHRAALRVAAWVLASRQARLRGRRPGVWEVVAAIAPELAEWAAYFGALELKRQAVAAGAFALVSTREADDLVRDARAFADAARWYRGRGGARHG